MSPPPPKVAIIGAGPAGCMLARLLHLSSIPTTIYEAEPSPNYRSQGGTLDFNAGIAALKAAKLYDEFLKLSRFDGSAISVCDKNVLFYMKAPASKAGNPEIDRVVLREMMVRSLPEGCVRWGMKVVNITEDGKGLHFETGVEEKGFDLIVGADGAWSKVRNYLTDDEPIYSGIAGYNVSIPNAAETAPIVAKFVNRGSVFSYSDARSVIAQQLGDGSIDVSLWIAQETDPRLNARANALTKEELLANFKNWAPELQNIIRATDGEIKGRSLYMLPVGNKFNHKPGVTLLGDAAHLMTPFGGEGVNLAFEDALKLANAIIDGSKGGDAVLDPRISAFEKDMFVRARKAQELTDGMMKDMFFTEGAPRSSIARWASRKVKYSLPSYISPVVTPLIYSFFFFYKLFV